MRQRNLIYIEIALVKTIFNIFLKKLWLRYNKLSWKEILFSFITKHRNTEKNNASRRWRKKLTLKKVYSLVVSVNCFSTLLCFPKLRKKKQQSRKVLSNAFLENPTKHSEKKDIQKKLYFYHTYISKSSTTEYLIAFSTRKTFNYFFDTFEESCENLFNISVVAVVATKAIQNAVDFCSRPVQRDWS